MGDQPVDQPDAGEQRDRDHGDRDQRQEREAPLADVEADPVEGRGDRRQPADRVGQHADE